MRVMNTATTGLSSSECSSGCESGWTMYLDQSSNSADQFSHQHGHHGMHLKSANEYYYKREDEEEEEEDLSMVSDASSGPPHFLEDRDEYYNHPGTAYFCNPPPHNPSSTSANKKKSKQHRPKQQQQCSNYNLDDTATSSPYQQYMGLPPFEASREQALGLSENYLKEQQSSLKKHFGFFKSSTSKKSGEAGGRR